MSINTKNAIQYLTDARSAIFVETTKVDGEDMIDSLERIEKLEGIQDMINKVELAIKECNV